METHTKQITKLTDDLTHHKEKIKDRLDTLADRGRERSQNISALKNEIEITKSDIKSKRRNAAENENTQRNLLR